MSNPVLPASLVIPALIRQVSSTGGFATVLAKGSAQGSAMLLVHRHQAVVRAYERVPGLDAAPVWRKAAEGEDPVAVFIARQQRFDPDLWVIELDVAELQRFIPDISTLD